MNGESRNFKWLADRPKRRHAGPDPAPAFFSFLAKEGRLRLKAGVTMRLDPASALFLKTRRERVPCVYILARSSHGTMYTGVTSDPPGRIYQHREGLIDGFTKRYGIKRLVWFEVHETMESAILREKRIKRWPREWKYDLIHRDNPTWRDLAEDWGFPPLPVEPEE